MSRIRKVFGTFRTHWKKSTFGLVVAGYGCNYLKDKREENLMMKAYCREALAYGEMGLPGNNVAAPAYHVTVILNPASDGVRGKTKFENYCEPLLHLAGIKVSTIRTEAQGQAKEIMEVMEKSDAVLVAGGDGTLMEAASGLMRRPDSEAVAKNVRFGVLPVGKNNTMAKTLFPGDDWSDVKRMAEATMSVVRQLYRPVDLLEVENIGSDAQFAGKKIYGFCQVQVGSLKDAKNRTDKYWYLPFVKRYLTYFFSYYSSANNIIRSCDGDLEIGTSVLDQVEENVPEELAKQPARSGLWSYVVPRSSDSITSGLAPKPAAQPSKKFAWENVGKTKASELVFLLNSPDKTGPGIDLYVSPELLKVGDFVGEGWSREYAKRQLPLPAWRVRSGLESVRWVPEFSNDDNTATDDEKLFYLDNEGVEVRGPIQITHLADKIRMFCAESQHSPDSAQDGQAGAGLKKALWKMQAPSITNKMMTSI